MKACCTDEAQKNLQRHRDVATCEQCGALLLAYDNDRDFDHTLAELQKHGIDAGTATLGKLKVISKPQT